MQIKYTRAVFLEYAHLVYPGIGSKLEDGKSSLIYEEHPHKYVPFSLWFPC